MHWNFSDFFLFFVLPYIVVGLRPWTGVHLLCTYSHRFNPRLLPFFCFPLVRMYSLGAQVITRGQSNYSHQSDLHPLHPHGHQKIHPSCSHCHRSGPCSPWGGYTPLLNHSIPHVSGLGACQVLSPMTFQGSDLCQLVWRWAQRFLHVRVWHGAHSRFCL